MPYSQTVAEPSTACAQCNTAPLCLSKALLLLHHVPAILIPSSVSLSKTVTQSLSRPLCLSVCQSAVSHSLIQSVSCSLSLSIPLSLFAHLTSCSLTHLHFLLIHHSTRLSCRVFRLSAAGFGQPLFLCRGNVLFSESPSCLFVFCSAEPWLSCLYFRPILGFILLGLEHFI